MVNASLPEAFTLFIDRDAWSAKLDRALRAAEIPFVAHRDLFAHDTPDEKWLSEAGRRGWLVLTRDQNIRRRPDELKALRNAGVLLFCPDIGQPFRSGNSGSGRFLLAKNDQARRNDDSPRHLLDYP